MTFWIVITVIALAITGLLVLALLRGRPGEEPPAAYDLRVYRDQLKEIDRDLARGVIAEEDADRVRAEVSRRILAADAQLKEGGDTGGQPKQGGLIMAALIAVILIGGGLGLYWKIGAPGYGDVPLEVRIEGAKEKHANRASQAEHEATLPVQTPITPDGEYAELIEKLRQTVADRPDDLQGHQLLARNEANLGNDKAAYEAQGHVLRLKGDDATTGDYMFHAELMISAAQGYVSPEAEASLRRVMQIQPNHPVARYYWGLMLIQNDRQDLAFRLWEQLLREGPHDAPWIGPIRANIERLAWEAGIKFQMPEVPTGPALSGPSAEDMQAASEMADEDRQAMIQGMVDSLNERLATEGGSAEEWARLIGAYGVLGESDKAAAIWAEAQQVFGGNADALSVVRAAAQGAGVAE